MKWVIGIIVLALLLGGAFFIYEKPSRTVSTEEMRYEIVDTEALRTKGLSGKTELPDDYGMLFVFDTRAKQGFWMKDMLLPIDIIWLSDTGVVLGIEEGVSPETYPHVFYSPEPVRYVLEVRSGLSQQKGWEVGSTIPLPLR